MILGAKRVKKCLSFASKIIISIVNAFSLQKKVRKTLKIRKSSSSPSNHKNIILNEAEDVYNEPNGLK